MSFSSYYKLSIVLLIVGGLVITIFLGSFTEFDTNKELQGYAPQASSTAFLQEVYGVAKNNYWQEVSDKKLIDYFVRGTEQLTNENISSVTDKEELFEKLDSVVSNMSPTKRDEFPAELANLVLTSLPPKQRSRLYTEQKERKLSNRVQNINPDRNLYNVLDTATTSNRKQIKEAYDRKKQQISSGRMTQALKSD